MPQRRGRRLGEKIGEAFSFPLIEDLQKNGYGVVVGRNRAVLVGSALCAWHGSIPPKARKVYPSSEVPALIAAVIRVMQVTANYCRCGAKFRV